MPTKIPHYHAKWVAARRKDYFLGKLCAKCGSTERLELDHIDPETKVHHAIWSWSKERRDKEAKKCQVLCHDCHKKKTAAENSARQIGGNNPASRKLTHDQVRRIRAMRQAGKTIRSIAAEFGIVHSPIVRMLQGKTYRDVVGVGVLDSPASRTQTERSTSELHPENGTGIMTRT